MSARPRPVTATFKPPAMAPPVGVRTRSYSLSSGASTESLVSVLDHDSYESLSESEAEEDNKPPVSQSEAVTTTYSQPTRTASHHSNQDSPNNQRPSGVEAWQKWMVTKARVARRKEHQQQISVKCEKEKQTKVKQEKEQNLKAGQEKVQSWIEEKTLADKIRKQINVRQSKVKQELEAEKKRGIDEKAKQNYEEWQKQKQNQEKDKRKAEKAKKKKENAEKEERQKKCQEAYDNWAKKAQKRPKSAHASLGYTSGKLTGYHNTASYPEPSYYNRVPWHPVDIPRVKTTRKRPNTAQPHKKWNPDKYF